MQHYGIIVNPNLLLQDSHELQTRILISDKLLVMGKELGDSIELAPHATSLICPYVALFLFVLVALKKFIAFIYAPFPIYCAIFSHLHSNSNFNTQNLHTNKGLLLLLH